MSDRTITLLCKLLLAAILAFAVLSSVAVAEKPLTPYEQLLEAVWRADVTLVKALLRQGGDPNARDWGGITPLMLAAAIQSNLEIMNLLLENGANIDARTETGETALMFAAPKGLCRLTELLLERGASLTRRITSVALL